MGGCKDCNDGCGGNIPVGPIGPIGQRGDNGLNGTNGISIIATFISDGVTPIGGSIYPLNTLIEQFSDLSYYNAGIITVSAPATQIWVDIVLLNGWASGTFAEKAQYSIFEGFLYFRGKINGTLATNEIFADGFTSLTNSVSTTISEDAALPINNRFLVQFTGDLKVNSYAAKTYLLNSVVPISIR